MIIAFSLSGGGSRGDFQLGAIELLYERGIRPDILTAASVGSLNAVKLAEGENPTDAARGLSGLRQMWCSLERNADMWAEEDWLTDPKMDQRIADSLRGSQAFNISGPYEVPNPNPHPLDGPAGVYEWLAKGFGNGMRDVAFLFGDGQAVLNSLDVIFSKARALYNLKPIEKLLATSLDIPSVNRWASNGDKKFRLALVALESGKLRYLTETGHIVERDDSAVPDPTVVPAPCSSLANKLSTEEDDASGLEAEIADTQAELRSAAPGEKGKLAAKIGSLEVDLAEKRKEIAKTKADLNQCRRDNAGPPLQLNDWRKAVLASASIPGIFPPVGIADEWYVDGGVREVIPMTVAVNLGAEVIYAIHASSRLVPPFQTPVTAGVFDIVARSLTQIAIDEIDLSDRVLANAPKAVYHIEPEIDLHDIRVVDPGLIQICRDYGYMMAADTVEGIDRATRRYTLNTLIASLRVGIWRMENNLAGQNDPSNFAAQVPQPDPTLRPQIDSRKVTLQSLITERRSLGGSMPADIDYWVTRPERHPWVQTPDLNLLVASVTPYPVPGNRAVSVRFTTKDATTGSSVAGKVKEDGTVIGDTNTTFSHNFKTTRRRVGGQWEDIYPAVTVSVPAYADMDVDCGFP